MIYRTISKKIMQMSSEYPVILLQGPRQSGKTTLVKELFSDKPYFLLEDAFVRERIDADPVSFFESLDNGAVFDEVQRYPEILSYLQGIVDKKNKKGMFILTGSNNVLLMQNVTQSLAGRVGIFSLLPFSIQELCASKVYTNEINNINTLILNGGYPRLIADKLTRSFFFQNYIDTYIDRDVRLITNIKDLSMFEKFLRVIATRVGSILDISSISSELGISVKTVESWLSILETSYICFRLYPYFENIGKRLVKKPKIYFYDTGILAYLLGITEEEQLDRERLRGNLFENLVILEFIKQKYNLLLNNSYYFYRTAKGCEIDLVEIENGFMNAYEIKSSSTFTKDFLKNITSFKNDFDKKIKETYVLYTGKENFEISTTHIKNFSSIFEIFSGSGTTLYEDDEE